MSKADALPPFYLILVNEKHERNFE
jgi:hypothetical protein